MRSRRLLEWVAAVLLAAAGTIHIRFGPIHFAEDALHGTFFYVVGVAQLATAVLLVGLRGRSQLLLRATIAGNAAVVAAWALTRFVAVPFGEGAGTREPVGMADTVATALEVALVIVLLPLVSRVRLTALTERAIPARTAGAALTAVALAALPLTAAASLLGPDGHPHRGHDHDTTEVAAGGHTQGHHDSVGDEAAHDTHDDTHGDAAGTHGDDSTSHVETGHEVAHDDGGSHAASTTSGSSHQAHSPGAPSSSHPSGAHPSGSHPSGPHPADPHPADPHPPGIPHPDPGPGEPPHPHPDPGPVPTGPIVSISDPRLTPAQQQAAMLLLGNTVGAMAAFPTIASVEAAGYESIGDEVTGYVHYVNWSYLTDGYEFDPARIESIVAKVNPDGSRTVVSALYIMNVGKTMADVPDIAGELTARGFHDHQNLCFNGHRLAGLGPPCPPGSVLLPTPPMVHVWLTPHPCGPFATVEGHGSTDCGHGH